MPYWYTKFEENLSMTQRRLFILGSNVFFLIGAKKKKHNIMKKIGQFSETLILQTTKLIFFKFGI